MSHSTDFTRLLQQAKDGDEDARARAFELVYDELRQVARRVGSDRAGHTLQPTAVVHEAWFKLAPRLDGVKDRLHFFAVASLAMRHWRSGAADGDWSRLLGMMDPEVTFHVPVAGFMHQQRGADAATRFFDHLTAVLRAELEVTSTLHDGDRVGFEVAVRGTMRGREFRQRRNIEMIVVAMRDQHRVDLR